MLKRSGLLFLFLVIVVLAVVLVRTALLKPQTITVRPATPIVLDRNSAIQRFVGAIRIPTESRPGQPPDQDAMLRMRNYLQQNFPRVHTAMQREVLPDGALLYTWKGRDPVLPPVIMMGHIDVVPAAPDTIHQWKHAPYSGDLADGFIWGRGTLDDKVEVLSLLEAAESLLAKGFTPARTILFAFGDDEENGGAYGAQKIVKLLKERGTRPEFVVDEGGSVVTGAVPGLSRPLAVIATEEKGYVDVTLSTRAPGGHASEPRPHTAIGELSAALAKLEARQFPASIPKVVKQEYAILAPYMPFSRRIVMANPWLFQPLLIHLLLQNPEQAASIHTTTAETIFNGGFKENALPTSARAVVNFRILPGETVTSVLDRIRSVVDDSGVAIAESNLSSTRNPSSISPLDSEGYRTLTSTISQIFPEAISTPNLMVGATDASYYTVLTPNVYRFVGMEINVSSLATLHNVDERIPTESYLKSVLFTAQLIQNVR